MKLSMVLAALLFSGMAFGKKSTCGDLNSCINLVSKITKSKYLIDKDIKGSIKLSSNFKITKENADEFLSEALYLNGYTRIATKPNQWTIINARDVRYFPTQSYEYGKDKIPSNHDYALVNIKLKNKNITHEIARNFRPFMSRYGRIIDIKATGTVVISDTGKNIHRLLGLIETIDKKPTEDEIEKYEEEKERKDELKELRAKNCSHIMGELKEIKRMLPRK